MKWKLFYDTIRTKEMRFMEKQEKKKGKIIYKIIIFVLLIIIGVCIYKIVGILSEYHAARTEQGCKGMALFRRYGYQLSGSAGRR